MKWHSVAVAHLLERSASRASSTDRHVQAMPVYRHYDNISMTSGDHCLGVLIVEIDTRRSSLSGRWDAISKVCASQMFITFWGFYPMWKKQELSQDDAYWCSIEFIYTYLHQSNATFGWKLFADGWIKCNNSVWRVLAIKVCTTTKAVDPRGCIIRKPNFIMN